MVGQKVICINNKNLPKMLPMSVAQQLVEGQIYTVKRFLHQEVQQEYAIELEEIEFPKGSIFQSFKLSRFLPVEPIKEEVFEEELELEE